MAITLPTIPPYLSAPKLDSAMVQTLQVAMQTELGWLDRAYHIARVGIDAEQKLQYPQIYKNDGSDEHYSLRPDNEIASYCFFEVDKQHSIDGENDEVEYFLSVVFWCNLGIIDNSKEYDFSSELIKDVTDLLLKYECTNFTYDQRPERIFDKYNGVTQDLKQHLLRRYSAFKISFSVKDSYTDNCTPDPINVCQMNIDRVNNLPTSVKTCVIEGLGGGTPAVVENSDQSYQEEIPAGDTLVLPDQEVEVFVDGVSQGSTTYPAMTNPTINILWT